MSEPKLPKLRELIDTAKWREAIDTAKQNGISSKRAFQEYCIPYENREQLDTYLREIVLDIQAAHDVMTEVSRGSGIAVDDPTFQYVFHEHETYIGVGCWLLLHVDEALKENDSVKVAWYMAQLAEWHAAAEAEQRTFIEYFDKIIRDDPGRKAKDLDPLDVLRHFEAAISAPGGHTDSAYEAVRIKFDIQRRTAQKILQKAREM